MIIKMPYIESIYVVKEKLNHYFLSVFNKYSDGLVFLFKLLPNIDCF